MSSKPFGSELWGQWIGKFTGQAPGLAFLNIDSGSAHKPFICVVQNLDGPLATRVVFNAVYAENTFSADSESILAFDAKTNQLVDGNEFLKRTSHQ